MNWSSLFESIWDWFFAFAEGLINIWQWLITPIVSFGDFQVAPIYAAVGAVAVIGLTRRLFRIF